MLHLLPKFALIVADAGYVGFELTEKLIEKNVFFLIRMSSQGAFYTDQETPVDEFHDGSVYYWPKRRKERGLPPLRGRLLCVRSRKQKRDVWLFTNVEDKTRLSLDQAATFYRWRWESEGFFRTYKRTLKKIKLMSQTVRLVHREAEASMIATQLLLIQGALAMPVATHPKTMPIPCSPRKTLLEIRTEIEHPKQRRISFFRRLAKAQRERRTRHTPKEKRQWPRRKAHQPPSPPRLQRLTDDDKSKIEQYFCAV
jgi:hypothetical protein